MTIRKNKNKLQNKRRRSRIRDLTLTATMRRKPRRMQPLETRILPSKRKPRLRGRRSKRSN